MVASQLRLSRLPSQYCMLPTGSQTAIYEQGEGAPLVVVPGLAGGVELVQPLVAKLAKRHRVITYQLRGERDFLLGGFSFDRHADDLAAVIDHLRLERPAIYGFSFGAAVALEYAVSHPRRVSWLVAQGVGPMYEAGVMAQAVRRVLERLRLPSDSEFLNQFLNVLLGNRSAAAETDREFVLRCIWQTEQAAMALRLEQLDEYDVTDRLWSLEAPTLVLSGEHDMVTPPADHKELARLIPTAEFQLIRDAGHLASVTHSQQVAAAVGAFQNTLQFV